MAVKTVETRTETGPRSADPLRQPIVDQIEAIVRDVPGWSPVDQLYTLFNLAFLNSSVEGDIVEIGSWCGRSTAVLGLAARRIGDLRVHAIDLFPARDDWKRNPDGSYSLEVSVDGRRFDGYRDQTVWKEPFERDIAPVYDRCGSVFELFQDTVRHNGLERIVRPFRGDSDGFFRSAGGGFKCRLAFIDGDHGYDAVCRDIRNVTAHLSEGGWICLDDAFSCYDTVDRAIRDCVLDDPAFDHCQQMTRKMFVARKKVKT